MKKSFSKLSTILLVLSMAITLLALPSCKSVSVVNSSEVQDVQKFSSVDTVYRHDSVFVREFIRGDTIYLTRTEWRDRWRIREVHDTIHNTQYITQTIEHPPERYVPKFYKWSTALFYILLLILCVIVFIKIKIRLFP